MISHLTIWTEQGPKSINTIEWTYFDKTKLVVRKQGQPNVEYNENSTIKCQWYVNGKLHREEGPAMLLYDNSEEWYIDGLLHRENGPAINHANGHHEWYLHGNLHRLDGPAIEYNNGGEWWINDCKLNTEVVEAWLEENNINLSTTEGQMAFKIRFT